MKKVEKMAAGMGISVDSLTKNQAEQALSSYNVLGTADRQAEQENKTWSHARMFGSLSPTSGLGKIVHEAGDSGSAVMRRLSKKEMPEDQPRDAVPLMGARGVQYNIQPMHRPPPGHEAGISNVAHGHKPNLGLPDLPPLQLPTAKIPENDIAAGGLPPLNITHTLAPIQIDITGIGDQIIRRTAKAEILKSDTNKIGGGALGGPR
jgi:hypothetical protein